MKRAMTALSMLAGMAACVNIDGISKDAALKVVPPIAAEAEVALVNFYHPMTLENLPVPLSVATVPGAMPLPIFFNVSNAYQLWQDDRLQGFLPVADRCLQVRVTPGKHTFLGRFVRSNAGNWTVLPANLEAGKTYYVKVVQRWNTWKPAVAFEILKPSDPAFGNIAACQAPVAYDRSSGASAEFWDRHVSANSGEVQSVLQALKAGSRDYYFDPEIVGDDGR
jgi:hypothetical protein